MTAFDLEIFNHSNYNIYFSTLWPLTNHINLYKIEDNHLVNETIEWRIKEFGEDITLERGILREDKNKKEISRRKQDSILTFIKSKIIINKPQIGTPSSNDSFAETLYDNMIFIESEKEYFKTFTLNTLAKGRYIILFKYPYSKKWKIVFF